MERKPITQGIPKDLIGKLKQNTKLTEDAGAGLERKAKINVERVILRAKIRISQENTTAKKH